MNRGANTGPHPAVSIQGIISEASCRPRGGSTALWDDLPLPQEIHEGVYFILGSQTDDLPDLPPKALQGLKEENRHIEMGGFSPKDTRALAEAAILGLSEEEFKSIFEQSDGHPLALIYHLKEITQIPDADERKNYF